MRKFICTESGTVFTEEGLINLYSQALYDDESMRDECYNDWFREATGKNGTLRELKQLTDEHKESIRSACFALRGSIRSLRIAMQGVTEESFNRCLSDNYPFLHDWDEAVWNDIPDWIGTVVGSLGELEAEYYVKEA